MRLLGGAVLLVLLLGSSLLAPWLSPHDPLDPDYSARYLPPGQAHPLGTDELGRDIATRALYGGRVSLLVALGATALAAVSGSLLGLAAGNAKLLFSGVWSDLVDTLLSRTTDTLLAFPGLLLILLVVVGLGGGVPQTILALGLAGSPVFFRLARAYSKKTLELDFVAAAVALGAGRIRVISHHVLPSFVSSLLVQAATSAAAFLLVEAALSYLGLGVAPPTPSWGNVLQGAQSYLTRQPWAALGPGLFLLAASLSFQLLADGGRNHLDKY